MTEQYAGVSSDNECIVRRASVADKAVLSRLLQLYLHDFSEFDGTDVGPHGEFDYRYFDNYWTESERHPFLIEVSGATAGFAFVRTGSPHDMAEFFILRKYRRQRVGRTAACLVLAEFAGDWQVRQLWSNPPATTFWRSILPYQYVDSSNDDGPIQLFTVPGT